MKKILLSVFIIFMAFFVMGCSSSDKKFIKDTADILADSNLPPQITFSTNIPSSIKVGEKFSPTYTFNNTGGGKVKYYINRYKNGENLIKYGCSSSGVAQHGIGSNGTVYTFNFKNNATRETADVNCGSGSENTFLSPGTYKYEFVFYNCADLKKVGAWDDCGGFSIEQEHQSEFSSKGVEPIKVETYQVVVTQ